jgi:nicotinamide mononucleotide transporter
VNEALLFALFYQVQLYSDMLLQLFFAAITIYGWLAWNSISSRQRSARMLRPSQRILSIVALTVITVGLGATMSTLHESLPAFFPRPAAAPYLDSFTAAGSIVATILMAQRAIESWVFWIVVDIASIILYVRRDIPAMSVLYCLFLMLAVRGLVSWRRQLANA